MHSSLYLLIPFCLLCFCLLCFRRQIQKINIVAFYVKVCSAYFSSRSFMVLGLTFRSFILFEFIFVYGMRKMLISFFYMQLSSSPNITYWRDCPFFIASSCLLCHVFSSVQQLSRVWLFATPWIAAHQASLSITNSQSLLKLMPIESMMPSSHLILCRPLLLLSPIPPRIRVFSNESTLCMRWPKYCINWP